LANIGEPVTMDHNVALISGALAYAITWMLSVRQQPNKIWVRCGKR
jgi:hypothetical protein